MATAINAPLNVNFQNGSQLTREIQGSVDRVKFNNLGGEKGFRSLSQPLGRLTGQADEFTKSLDAANARVLAFGASVGVVNAVSNAFKSLVNSTIEVEKAITAISVVGDQFNGKTKQLSQGLFNIAKTTGQSFGEVSKAALEFSRQGLNLEDTLARTNDALILTRTTGLESAKSVDGLTAAVNAFAKAGLSTTQVLNKLAAVDQAFAVSSADLIEAFQRTGAVAQQAGVSFDELAGIVTALQTETSRGGADIGNALKTIFSRLQDTSTLTQLQDLGVAVQDLQGNLLPARQILQNLAGDVQGLSKVTQAGVFKDVAGTFQLNKLISLVNDLNKAQSISAAATQKSAGATNEAYVANEKLNQSLDAILNKVITTGKQLGSVLGEIGLTDNLKGLLDGINSFLEGVNNVLQGDDIGSRFAKGLVKGIGAVLSGPGFGIFLAIIAKLSYDLLRFGTESLKTFFNIGKAASDQKQIQESIVQVLLRNRSVLKEIENTQGGQNAQALKFLGILNQQAAAMKDVQGLASNIAGKAYSAGYRQTDRGLARRSAGGYLPAQEASDVRRGVGGASPSSKVVSIPNFAFGGGKRGTMVANTSEYIVPNYAGGGSAIFNQDMVKTMGLPAGAKKISAAGGFVPNFATPETRSTKRKENQTASEFALIVNDQIQKPYAKYFPVKGEDIQYLGLVAGINPEKKMQDAKGGAFNDSKFTSASLVEKYTKLAIKDASDYSSAIVGKPITPVSVQRLSNPGVASGLVGAIFENGISAAIQDPEMSRALATRDPNAPFDFIKGVTSDAKLNKFFGIPSSIKYIEAKYSLSEGTASSFGDKIHAELLRRQSGIIKDKKPKKASGATIRITSDKDISKLQTPLAQSGSFNFRVTSDRVSQSAIQAFINAGGIQTNSSSGYIPNFAAAALQQAIAREKSAGLSNSQIYVDQNSSLKSPLNPMGLMVANTRDEPFGGIQGISRARNEGANPKTYGAANGFVPNYAVPSGLSGYAASLNPSVDAGNVEAVNKGFGDTAGKIIILQSALAFLSGAVGEGETSMEKFTQQLAQSSGNITSLAFLGKEIQGINIEAKGMKGALGNFAKKAGLAGIALGIAVEGFDLLDFAIKEFSGENEKAALATAKLADASDKLSIKFDSLSKTRQTEISTQAEKILGSAGYEGFFNGIANFFRDQKIGGGDIGGNAEVKKGTAQLLALGASEEQIQQVIKNSKKTKDETVYAASRGGVSSSVRTVDITQASDIIDGLEKSMTETSGVGKGLSDKFLQFSSQIEDIDFSNDAKATKAIKKIQDAIYGSSISEGLAKTIEGEKKRQEQDFKTKAAKQAIDFDKPINVLKRSLETIIFQGGLAVENISKQLERESQAISAISSSKSFASLGDSSRIAFEINSSTDQFQKQYKNEISKFTKETQESLLGYIPALGIGKDNSGIIENQVKNIGAATSKKDFEESLQAFQKQLTDLGVDLNLPELEKLKNQITSSTDGFKNLNEGLDVQSAILALQNQERLLEAQAYDTYRNKLAEFVEETAQSTNKLARFRGEIERIAITQESNIVERTSVSKTGREDVIIRAQEEFKAFQERKVKERAVLLEEQAMAAKEEFFTKENIAGLNRNTEALNALTLILGQDFINKIDESIKFVQEMRGSTGGSAFGGNPVSLPTGITLPSGIKDSQDALNYLQNLRNAYSPSTSPKSSNGGVNMQTAGGYIDQIKSSFDTGGTFESAQKLIASFNVNAEYSDKLTEFARKLFLSAQAQDATMTQQEETLKQSLEASLRNYDIINSYNTKLNNALKSVRDSLTDPQSRGEFLLKEGVIRRGEKEGLLGTAEEKRAYRSSFGYGFDEAMDKLQARTLDFQNQLGQEIPDLFSSNLTQGLNDAISGAKDLKTALTDAATAFFQEITRKNISNLADMVTGGIGGFFTKKASGGLISGGSGTKDDVPAMLMGGEYVVKKSAVSKYGKGFLDAINSGNMRGYATGGIVDPQTFPTQTGSGGFFTPGDYGQGAITGKNELLTFASQSFTGGQYDYMGGFGMGGATVSLEPESGRLSALGREGSPMFERVQQSKDEAFRVYLEGLQKEKEYAELLDQRAKNEKARKKQLQMAIISAVVSSALSAAGNRGQTGAKNKIAAQAGAAGISELSGMAKAKAGVSGFTKGIFTSSGNALTPQAESYYKNLSNIKSNSQAYSLISKEARNPTRSYANYDFKNGEYKTRAAGGLISGGSNVRDDVPAMLTGGEFVLNNRATQRLGVQNLNKLNSGAPVSSEGASAEMTQALVSKLDELIQATSNSSKENVVVNVSTSEAGNQTSENPAGAEKELHKKIRQAVLDVIAQEKRLGGSLEKSR